MRANRTIRDVRLAGGAFAALLAVCAIPTAGVAKKWRTSAVWHHAELPPIYGRERIPLTDSALVGVHKFVARRAGVSPTELAPLRVRRKREADRDKSGLPADAIFRPYTFEIDLYSLRSAAKAAGRIAHEQTHAARHLLLNQVVPQEKRGPNLFSWYLASSERPRLIYDAAQRQILSVPPLNDVLGLRGWLKLVKLKPRISEAIGRQDRAAMRGIVQEFGLPADVDAELVADAIWLATHESVVVGSMAENSAHGALGAAQLGEEQVTEWDVSSHIGRNVGRDHIYAYTFSHDEIEAEETVCAARCEFMSRLIDATQRSSVVLPFTVREYLERGVGQTEERRAALQDGHQRWMSMVRGETPLDVDALNTIVTRTKEDRFGPADALLPLWVYAMSDGERRQRMQKSTKLAARRVFPCITYSARALDLGLKLPAYLVRRAVPSRQSASRWLELPGEFADLGGQLVEQLRMQEITQPVIDQLPDETWL